MPKSLYSKTFFDGRKAQVQSSAEVLVNHMYTLFHPKSVVDVGCGDGAWLAEWIRFGVEDIQGIDGNWVNEQVLKIPVTSFKSHDLNEPLKVDRRFDLCTSFEVAEHLSPASAVTFVRTLTSLSDVVVFSAAIPGQGGTGHINEQWQQYWMAKFNDEGFIALDPLSPLIWNADNIQACYIQNTLAFISQEKSRKDDRFRHLAPATTERCGTRLHPRSWSEKITEGQDLARFGCIALLKALPRAISNSIRMRLGTK